MCGIWGITKGNETIKAEKALNVLKNRGPDFSSTFFNSNISLAHTRLSIVDFNDRSNQPFETEKCVLVFNGEIYNFKDIKKSYLKDYNFKTQSDTEIIVALYEVFGTEGFKFLSGMFAFILYDKEKNFTFFLRDPLGIKPLYFTYSNGIIEAASLMSALSIEKKVDLIKTNDILALGYPRVPVYKGIREFKPGIVYKYGLSGNLFQQNPVNFIKKKKSFKTAILEHYDNSDRPIGITLSGGIDSAYIAYVCNMKHKIETFTIGFSKNDEDVVKARKLAKIIGSKHHEIIINKNEIQKYYNEAIKILEIPMDLGSVVQTYLLAKEISKTDIKVILIGEGADEVNGGYKRYKEAIGKTRSELSEWYKNRVTKYDYDERKKILKDDAIKLQFPDINTNNNILDFDIENELRFFHLKRIDHIISHFGIEARVPYLDYSLVQNIRSKPFNAKLDSEKDKKLLRNEAKKEGLPVEFYERPKKPLKLHDNMKNIILKNVKDFLNEKK